VKDVNRQLRDANKYNDEGETYYPVNVIIVPMVMAEDGKKISSTRIYNREINAEG
jgi:phosphopantetheine adenylyltransferase